MCFTDHKDVGKISLVINQVLRGWVWCYAAQVSWHDGNEQVQEFSSLRQTEQYHWEALAENRVVQQALILSSAPNLIDPCDSHHQC